MHNYSYNKARYGDVAAIEKVCMNCGLTELENPRPTKS